MRPRPDAAENSTGASKRAPRTRFNEAAARCRGKPDERLLYVRDSRLQ